MPEIVRELIAAAARAHKVPTDLILARDKNRPAVAARTHVMMKLRARGWSYSRIGRVFLLNGSTVTHHIFKAQGRPLRHGRPEQPYPVPDLSGEWAI
jgi:hypothetical protein